MKNIGIIYERELDFGGVETHLLSLFRYSNPDEYSFIVFSPTSENFRQQSPETVKFFPIPAFAPLSLKTTFNLRNFFRQEKIQLVHMHSPIAAIPGRLAAWQLHIPTLVHTHAPAKRYYGQINTIRANLGRRLFTNIDRLLNFFATNQMIFVSEKDLKEAVSSRMAPYRRSVAIPNGIDLDSLCPVKQRDEVRQSLNVKKNDVVIIYTGRLGYEKGVDYLLRAIRLLPISVSSQVKIWIVGTGPQETIFKNLSNELEIAHRVHWLGYQTNIADFLFASDIFVLPSLNEAMSLSILEALAAGLPSVVTNVGENTILVENNLQGLIIPPGDSPSLALALSALVQNPMLRSSMGKSAQEKSKQYSVKNTIEKIESLYKLLIR